MTHFMRFITGLASTAFIAAAFFNNQLTWNSEAWNTRPVEYDGRLVQMHTNQQTKEYNKAGHDANKVELKKFFQSIPNPA